MVEQTVRRIADAITIGLLRPGDRLPPEAELSGWLRIAPMTLREALAKLREAGYIETRRGRGGGNFVGIGVTAPTAVPPDIDADYLNDLKDFRRALLSQSAALAAERATDAELQALTQRASASSASSEETFWHPSHEAQFHIALARCSGSDRLWRHQTSTEMEFNGIAMTSRPRLTRAQIGRLHSDHEEILEALTRRDSDAAFAVAAAHADRASDALIALFNEASKPKRRK